MTSKQVQYFLLCCLFVFFLPCSLEAIEPSNGPPSKGIILGKGPKANNKGGLVGFFNITTGPPSGNSDHWRVPDHLTFFNQNDSFEIRINPGKYYIGVILGRKLKDVGAPRSGEQHFTAFGPDDQIKVFEVIAGQKTDTGILSGKKMPQGVRQNLERHYLTVKGVVEDEHGVPVAQAKVIAFRDGDIIRKPITICKGTDKDGNYYLKLPPNDSYNISVRVGFGGGQPLSGEYVGRYGGEQMQSVSGKKGQTIENINITVFTVPERNPENNEKPQQLNRVKESKRGPLSKD